MAHGANKAIIKMLLILLVILHCWQVAKIRQGVDCTEGRILFKLKQNHREVEREKEITA